MLKRILLAALIAAATAGCNDAQTASQNLSRAADNASLTWTLMLSSAALSVAGHITSGGPG